MITYHPLLQTIQQAWQVAKPFQIEDAEFAARNGRIVLGHRTGLGKTFMALLAWSQWYSAKKGLIVGTLGSMATWHRLLLKWAGVEPTFLQGAGDPRWDRAAESKEGVYMCTYATLRMFINRWHKQGKRGKPHFDVLANDEIHREMRNRNVTVQTMKQVDSDFYIGLSATWASRGPQDCYPILNLIAPRTFPSYWRFVNTWCYVEDTPFGKDVFGVRHPEQLQKMLHEHYYVTRSWREVGEQFGASNVDPIIRRAEIVPMSKKQAKLVDQLDKDMIAELDKERVVTPNSLAKLTRKLQLAVSPRILFEGAEFGGPVDWLVEKIMDDPHTVVFCPFKAGLRVVHEALQKAKFDKLVFTLQGGVQPDAINRLVEAWKKAEGVMLCTTAFAQSFDLDTTETAYMLGFEWDPNNNYQAEGRLRRLDSVIKEPCLVRYIIPEGSDYQAVMEVLDGKTINTRQFLSRRLKVEDQSWGAMGGADTQWGE